MTEIYSNLFIGDQNDYDLRVAFLPGWSVVQACKEPYHRQAVGYRERGAPKDHPEYLLAYRDNRMILNLIDVPDPKFINRDMIDDALRYIHQALANGQKVLVHCNFGSSRGPSIGLLYLLVYTDKLPTATPQAAIGKFRTLYPRYNPGKGFYGFICNNWRSYCNQRMR